MIETYLESIGLNNCKVNYNLSPDELINITLEKGQGVLTDTDALSISTGEFTGRSPKDKYVVFDNETKDKVWWGDVNHPFSEENFDNLYQKMKNYLDGKEIFIRDCQAGADPRYKINLKVITETPWANLFAYNMFLRTEGEIDTEWTILCIPSFKAKKKSGTRQHNFTIINFTKKVLLIGGSAYTGEIKKGVFTILNKILVDQGVLPMHCSANMGKDGDTALFYGLSGTGKTCLSSNPNRDLIGDDEHGWSDNSIFNFEGGCYAKCVNLSAEKEPDIFGAIRKGSILENIGLFKGTNKVDFSNISITENTRVSYPLSYIGHAIEPSIGKTPNHIFFLTADATGVLPAISKLTVEQAMYHFLSGYTAKVAGTEVGVVEPQLTFSACFGKAFIPLHPSTYAKLFGEKISHHDVKVWLINTGWIGGSYGTGHRIELKYTRRLIEAALNNELESVKYETSPIFNLQIPTECEGIPSIILNPRNLWKNTNNYDLQLNKLALAFNENFNQYRDQVDSKILEVEPHI